MRLRRSLWNMLNFERGTDCTDMTRRSTPLGDRFVMQSVCQTATAFETAASPVRDTTIAAGAWIDGVVCPGFRIGDRAPGNVIPYGSLSH